MNENYNAPEDFIAEQTFPSWVFKTTDKHTEDWDLWLASHPEKLTIATEAASILKLTRFKDNPVDSRRLDVAETRLRKALSSDKFSAKILNIKTKRTWYAVEAVLVVALAFGLSIIFNSHNKSQLATNYGQVKKDRLPDGTEVI